jgi:hypothetical protein
MSSEKSFIEGHYDQIFNHCMALERIPLQGVTPHDDALELSSNAGWVPELARNRLGVLFCTGNNPTRERPWVRLMAPTRGYPDGYLRVQVGLGPRDYDHLDDDGHSPLHRGFWKGMKAKLSKKSIWKRKDQG